MFPAREVAKLLIRLAAADPEGEAMTAMRLHKLLYYCQGWYLAWYGEPLFPERIEAWTNGPVVPEVWALPWGQGKNALPDPGGPVDLPDRVRAAVEQVWGEYRKFSAWGLRDKTHEEPPWKDHYKPDPAERCSAIIPPVEMEQYFGDEFCRRTGEKSGSIGDFEADISAGRTVTLVDLRKEWGI